MGLYNTIFGTNNNSDLILKTLGLMRGDVGRFRDCHVALGEIVVYTRNGGGNRDCWEKNEAGCTCPGCIITYILPKHPNYLRDQDDDFDSTYATIYFSFPEDFKYDLAALDSGSPFNTSQRWKDMIETIRNLAP